MELSWDIQYTFGLELEFDNSVCQHHIDHIILMFLIILLEYVILCNLLCWIMFLRLLLDWCYLDWNHVMGNYTDPKIVMQFLSWYENIVAKHTRHCHKKTYL